MNKALFIESEWGKRRINHNLTSNQFAIGRIRMPYVIKIGQGLILPEDFKIGDYFFSVVTGPEIDKELVDGVIAKARRETILYGARDDLSETAGLTTDDPNYDVYRLAHALEHLTGCDIYERGVSLNPRRKGKMQGAAFFSARRFPPRIDIGFHFDQNFTTPEQIAVSVRNATKKATSVFTC